MRCDLDGDSPGIAPLASKSHTHAFRAFTTTATIQPIPFLRLQDQLTMASRCLEVGPRP
jgi:hypothetical protein